MKPSPVRRTARPDSESDLVVRNQARLFAAMLLSDTKRMERFEEVAGVAEDRNGRWYEGEQLVIQAIREQNARRSQCPAHLAQSATSF